MLKWIAGKLHTLTVDMSPQVAVVSENLNTGGWFSPQNADALLSTRARKQALQQLWDNSPFSRQVWDAFWLEPVRRLAVRLQQLPAASTGPYAREGGMLDEALEVAVCAVRLSRGWMLPPGAPPEEQAAQSAAWCTAIFWAALLHDLGSLEQMAAFHEDGRRWYLGVEVPDAPWRVRFCDQTTNSVVRAATSAYRLLPCEGLRWVARWPQLMDALLVYLSGDKSAAAILHAAVSEAREKCGLFAQHTSLLSSVNSAAENPESLRQSALQASAEHPTDEFVISPIVSAKNNDNDSQSPNGVPVSLPGSELVSAISQSEPVDEIVSGTDTPLEGGTPGELLTLLDKMTGAEPTDISGSASSVSLSPAEALLQPISDETFTSGEHFWNWLIDSTEEGTLSVNAQDSLLHIMAQYVFIQTPDCFYRYLATRNNAEADKNEVQKTFEALNRHYSRNGKGIYIYRKYENDGREGRFTKMSGYMIPVAQVFKKGVVLSDSPWLAPNK
ncbi:TraI domain-containing protein [Pectobacteriaceae bacterium C52]|nr:TraI domain-containing protein [Pectobacteriaceae bacterium C52]